MDDNNGKALWNANVVKYDLGWPDECVVRFLAKSYRGVNKAGVRVLDFGCGSGRNALAMVQSGFDVVGADQNTDALALTQKKVAAVGGTIETIENVGMEVPLREESIDCAVCWGCLYLSKEAERKLLLRNVCKVIKPGGLLLANWRADDDYFCGKGEALEKNVYVLDDRAAAYGLAGMTYYFAPLDDLRALYEECGFEIYNVEKRVFVIDNMAVANAHWHIWARKR